MTETIEITTKCSAGTNVQCQSGVMGNLQTARRVNPEPRQARGMAKMTQAVLKEIQGNWDQMESGVSQRRVK